MDLVDEIDEIKTIIPDKNYVDLMNEVRKIHFTSDTSGIGSIVYGIKKLIPAENYTKITNAIQKIEPTRVIRCVEEQIISRDEEQIAHTRVIVDMSRDEEPANAVTSCIVMCIVKFIVKYIVEPLLFRDMYTKKPRPLLTIIWAVFATWCVGMLFFTISFRSFPYDSTVKYMNLANSTCLGGTGITNIRVMEKKVLFDTFRKSGAQWLPIACEIPTMFDKLASIEGCDDCNHKLSCQCNYTASELNKFITKLKQVNDFPCVLTDANEFFSIHPTRKVLHRIFNAYVACFVFSGISIILILVGIYIYFC